MHQVRNKKNRRRWPWLIFLAWFLSILAVSVFVTGWLESMRPFAIDNVLYTTNIDHTPISILISPQSIINAVTLSAFLFAIFQLYFTRKEIDQLTETVAISSTQEIVEQISDKLSRVNEITDVYLASATIAIGKTGANEQTYTEYTTSIDNLVSKIGKKCHFKYFEISDNAAVTNDSKGKEYFGLDDSSELLKFYKDKKFSDDVVKKIIIDTIELHLKIKDKIHYVGVTRGISPHFILINPDSWDRVAIIWNVDGVSSTDKKVISAGFITSNIETIRVMKGIFDGIS